jgi:hypothetical protein
MTRRRKKEAAFLDLGSSSKAATSEQLAAFYLASPAQASTSNICLTATATQPS